MKKLILLLLCAKPFLFVALLGFTAPPVELRVYFEHQFKSVGFAGRSRDADI